MTNRETNIQNSILLTLSERGILAWRQHVGMFRPVHGGAPIRIGVTGMSDIGAIVPVTITPEMVGRTIGVAAQIEVKTASGRIADAQAAWGQVVSNRGALYGVARSVDDALRITRNLI